jgi:hypothetical protein
MVNVANLFVFQQFICYHTVTINSLLVNTRLSTLTYGRARQPIELNLGLADITKAERLVSRRALHARSIRW